MNGNCDTKVKQILDAIEYGKLLPADTEKRLLDMIECEINKEDTAADMGLISIAQDLLFELHNLSCERTEENERRLDQLRQRIEATVEKRESRGLVTRRIVKIVAVAAAFILLAVGISSPIQWTWFESWSTPDEQQRVVQLHSVSIDLVSQAIADNDSSGLFVVNDAEDIDKYLGFDLEIPNRIGDGWHFEEGHIQYFFDSVELAIRYTHSERPDNSFSSHIIFYTDPEFAWFVFEQSHDGKSVSVNGQKIYVTKNVDKVSTVWHHATTVIHSSGKLLEDEMIMLTLELIGE